MNTLILEPTPTAQWQALVTDAASLSSINLQEEIESYLVFLLMRFASNPEITNSILATDFLRSLEQLKKVREQGLQEVGDKCLLFAGLFPGLARKRRVRISYFVKLGQTAYSYLSNQVALEQADLYEKLGDGFVSIMDIMHSMRELDANLAFLDLLQAEELWTDTQSLHALKTLRRATRGYIMSPNVQISSQEH